MSIIDKTVALMIFVPLSIELVVGIVVLFCKMFSIHLGNDDKYYNANSSIINIACTYLENGYIQLKKGLFETNRLVFKLNEKNNEFEICINLDDDAKKMIRFSPILIQDGNWKISQDGNYLKQTYPATYTGSWNRFEQCVWKKIHEKHPLWRKEGVNIYTV